MEIKLVKAFTKNPKQGNPAGVTLNSDNLTAEKMIQISADLGFTESAFVQKSDKADFRVRYFSPVKEVNLCGHATIATIQVLLEEGLIKDDSQIKIETLAGNLPIEISKNGLITMTQADPVFNKYNHDKSKIADLLNISEENITELPLKTVSTGTPKLMIPVDTLKTLFEIKPDLEGIKKYCEESGARGFYPFTSETIEENSDFHARQFNPLAGIPEDPITGVAAGALGAYMKEYNISPKRTFIIEQGNIMNQSGKIFVNVEDSVKVGGHAVIYGEKT